jgi:hypothetical protein
VLGKFVGYLVLNEEFVGYLELVLSATLSPRSRNCSIIVRNCSMIARNALPHSSCCRCRWFVKRH